jgi:hypothetical protein
MTAVLIFQRREGVHTGRWSEVLKIRALDRSSQRAPPVIEVLKFNYHVGKRNVAVGTPVTRLMNFGWYGDGVSAQTMDIPVVHWERIGVLFSTPTPVSMNGPTSNHEADCNGSNNDTDGNSCSNAERCRCLCFAITSHKLSSKNECKERRRLRND